MTGVVALLLALVALAMVVGLVTLLARPLIGPALAALERARFRRALGRVARGDAQLRAGHVEHALHEFEAAFCFLVVRGDTKLVDQIAAHHTGLLSRLLTVADELNEQRVRLFALAKVDRLLTRRGEMQRAYLQLRNRGLRDGRRIQLGRELAHNGRDARAAVRELVADIQMLRGRRTAVQ